MKDKTNTEVIVINESLNSSILADFITFACWLFSLFVNYKYLGQNDIATGFTCIMLVIVVLSKGTKRIKRMSVDEGYLYLKGIVELEWQSLSKEHRKFIIRVRKSNGAKNGAEPHYSGDGKISFWQLAESKGYIKCTGSYKWVVTEKFTKLEEFLFYR